MSRGKNSAVKSTFGKEHVDYVMQYGGKCRDCADRNGICEATGISCGEKEKAVKYVLDAISYGINNGYIPSNCQSVQAQENLKAKRQPSVIKDVVKANLLNTSDWAVNWSIERNVDREYCQKLSEILTAFMAHLITVGKFPAPWGGIWRRCKASRVAVPHLAALALDTPLLAAGCFIR